MRNMARSICSVGMRSFIVCFDTGSPAKVTSTVDGRNNAIGEALRRTQGDWKEEGGMNPAPTSNCQDGRPRRAAPTVSGRAYRDTPLHRMKNPSPSPLVYGG